jgi:hypothetical protein
MLRQQQHAPLLLPVAAWRHWQLLLMALLLVLLLMSPAALMLPALPGVKECPVACWTRTPLLLTSPLLRHCCLLKLMPHHGAPGCTLGRPSMLRR